MSAHELAEWQAFEQVDGPMSVEQRIDIGFARLMYLIAKVNHYKGREPQPFDFLPPYIQEEIGATSQQSPEQMRAVMESMISADD